MLTATPVPQGGRRQAVADQVVWLTHSLHTHHQTEDAGLWPLVRRRNPAAAGLLEATEAEHRTIVPEVEALTAAAQQYRSAPGDAARLKLIQALEALTALLLPHLGQEVAEAMPVVAQTLTARTGMPGTGRPTSRGSRCGNWAGRALADRRDRPGGVPGGGESSSGGAAVHPAARVRPALPHTQERRRADAPPGWANR